MEKKIVFEIKDSASVDLLLIGRSLSQIVKDLYKLGVRKSSVIVTFDSIEDAIYDVAIGKVFMDAIDGIIADLDPMVRAIELTFGMEHRLSVKAKKVIEELKKIQ